SAAVAPDAAPNTYLIRVSGMTGTGTIRVTLPGGSVTDVAGNPLANDVVSNADVLFDGDAPTVTITTNAPQPTNADLLLFTILFSDPVPAFGAADLQLTGPAT